MILLIIGYEGMEYEKLSRSLSASRFSAEGIVSLGKSDVIDRIAATLGVSEIYVSSIEEGVEMSDGVLIIWDGYDDGGWEVWNLAKEMGRRWHVGFYAAPGIPLDEWDQKKQKRKRKHKK